MNKKFIDLKRVKNAYKLKDAEEVDSKLYDETVDMPLEVFNIVGTLVEFLKAAELEEENENKQ